MSQMGNLRPQQGKRHVQWGRAGGPALQMHQEARGQTAGAGRALATGHPHPPHGKLGQEKGSDSLKGREEQLFLAPLPPHQKRRQMETGSTASPENGITDLKYRQSKRTG